MRTAIIVEDSIPVNIVVFDDGAAGDEWLKNNSDAVEVTGLNPMPGIGEGWTYVNKKWVAPPAPKYTRDEISALRQAAYQLESDPIFFQFQRNDGSYSKQDWLDKVAEIDARYPYPA